MYTRQLIAILILLHIPVLHLILSFFAGQTTILSINFVLLLLGVVIATWSQIKQFTLHYFTQIITWVKVHQPKRTPSIEPNKNDSDLLEWSDIWFWLHTPLLPITFFEWVLAITVFTGLVIFFYISAERVVSGYHDLGMFFVWDGY